MTSPTAAAGAPGLLRAASLLSVLNVCKAGDSFISTGTIYGGTVNLFAVTLKRFGIECIFVDQEASREELQKAIKPNTRCVFGETLANPALAVLDIKKFADFAHDNGLPLIIDMISHTGSNDIITTDNICSYCFHSIEFTRWNLF